MVYFSTKKSMKILPLDNREYCNKANLYLRRDKKSPTCNRKLENFPVDKFIQDNTYFDKSSGEEEVSFINELPKSPASINDILKTNSDPKNEPNILKAATNLPDGTKILDAIVNIDTKQFSESYFSKKQVVLILESCLEKVRDLRKYSINIPKLIREYEKQPKSQEAVKTMILEFVVNKQHEIFTQMEKQEEFFMMCDFIQEEKNIEKRTDRFGLALCSKKTKILIPFIKKLIQAEELSFFAAFEKIGSEIEKKIAVARLTKDLTDFYKNVLYIDSRLYAELIKVGRGDLYDKI